MKYAFMAHHRRVWPIRWMSQALGVSTSGFYEWLTRPESNLSMTNRTILVRIRESFEASHQTYGSPAYGEICGTGTSPAARTGPPGSCDRQVWLPEYDSRFLVTSRVDAR